MLIRISLVSIATYVCVLLLSDAQMWELTDIVIPNISAQWESLAYCMRYNTDEVEAFRKDSQDVKECSKRLFVNWIKTSHGPTPKTYKTLLKHIKKIKELRAASEVVERELIEGNNKQITNRCILFYLLFYHSSTSGSVSSSNSLSFNHAVVLNILIDIQYT